MFDASSLDHGDYRRVIRLHSRSFSLAARLLPRRLRSDVEKLYAWCRLCDDAVDRAPTQAEAAARLQQLWEDVERIYAGQPCTQPGSRWLAELVAKYGIPKQYPLALLEGMRSDLEGSGIRDEQALLLYCHRAAGTVGLMMCSLLGVSDPRALRCADALGIAMQLTNIARDVHEDWQAGRCYLPQSWFGGPPTRDTPLTNGLVKPHVARILEMSETHYRIGLRGVPYLPENCRFSIRIAAKLYAEIGQVIRRNACHVLGTRARVPWSRKMWILAQELLVTPVRLGCRAWIDRMPNGRPSWFCSPSGEAMRHQAPSLVTLGISLSAILATAMFVMVGLNPKDADSYGFLPWLYAIGCFFVAAITQVALRRMEANAQLVPQRVVSECHDCRAEHE